MQFKNVTEKTANFALNNLVLLRNCLHVRDVAPLRLSRKPLPWSKLMSVAPVASTYLPKVGERDAVEAFAYRANMSIAGMYRQDTRSIEVHSGRIGGQNPQAIAQVIMHEMAHALLHAFTDAELYSTERGTYAQVECQAELTALTTIYLMGFQLPADAFDCIKHMTASDATRRVYHALIDCDFEDSILPAATSIAAAFKAAGGC